MKIALTGLQMHEKSPCILWSAKGHEMTAIQRKFWVKYWKSAPMRSNIFHRYLNYQASNDHSYVTENERPQISDVKKEMIRSMFREDLRVF